jgi:hypothetical protein
MPLPVSIQLAHCELVGRFDDLVETVGTQRSQQLCELMSTRPAL